MSKQKVSVSGLVVVGVAALVAACGGPGGRRDARTAVAAGGRGGATPETTPCGASASTTPIGAPSGSSTIALARIGGRRVALVADEDAKAILTVDLETRDLLAETALGSRPGQLMVTRDGRVLVTLRDASKVLSLSASSATSPLAKRCEAGTPVEPIAFAADATGKTLAVASGWGASLAVFDAETLSPRHRVALAREPRGVVLSEDGHTAFVSHAVGARMSAVTLDAASAPPVTEIPLRGRDAFVLEQKLGAGPSTRRARAPFGNNDAEGKGEPSCQGFAVVKAKSVPGRIFAPEVFVDPGDPSLRPDGYGDVNKDTETPNVAVIDERAKAAMLASVVLPVAPRGRQLRMAKQDAREPRPDCLLPRAAAVDEATGSLLVTCFGIDAVVAYDAKSPAPHQAERKRWTVGSGPSGIAVDDEKHEGVVWSQFDRTLASFAIGDMVLSDERAAPVAVVRTALPALKDKVPAEYALGRLLFHAGGDLRLSGDGRACASCHPDGRDDGITWATPEGPRRSIALAGRVSRTPPYSWNGNERTIAGHLASTFDRLSGSGLHGMELDALVAFVAQMPAPPARPVDDAERAKVERGRAVFASDETRCATCHGGADMTDGQNHEVTSKHNADRETAFNTPSLRFVSGAGPFFHDGRYATLGELLDKTDGTMGRTKHLSAADRDALEAFLRTL